MYLLVWNKHIATKKIVIRNVHKFKHTIEILNPNPKHKNKIYGFINFTLAHKIKCNVAWASK